VYCRLCGWLSERKIFLRASKRVFCCGGERVISICFMALTFLRHLIWQHTIAALKTNLHARARLFWPDRFNNPLAHHLAKTQSAHTREIEQYTFIINGLSKMHGVFHDWYII